MAGFTYRLEHQDETPADPPTFHTVVPTWRPGDTIPLGADRMLRAVAIREDDADHLRRWWSSWSPLLNDECAPLEAFSREAYPTERGAVPASPP
jgi:hypothetical protein